MRGTEKSSKLFTMDINKYNTDAPEHLAAFLVGKSDHTLMLLDHFLAEFQKIGPVIICPAKTMIGLSNSRKRIVYITQLGKNFIHVVFPFTERYDDNFCFQKIVHMPAMFSAITHHLRIYRREDVNDAVRKFMRIAYES
jgi:hypothetical protein